MHTELNNHELVEMFFNRTSVAEGLTNHPSANTGAPTMHTERLPDGTLALIGYGWQKYAEILPNGRVIVYEGHDEWAREVYDKQGLPTTARHMSLVRDAAETFAPYNVEYRSSRPTVAAPPRSVRQIARLGRHQP